MTLAAAHAPPLPGWARCGIGLLVSLGWAGSVWVAAHIEVDASLERVALFAHLACLVVGFGAVLALDWCGLQWLLGRRPLAEITRMATGLHQLIWIGLAGLVLSGILLGPQLGDVLTRVKLALVLVVALNGVQAQDLQGRLEEYDAVPRHLLVRLMASAGLSQAGWWGCMVIGFLNSGR